MTAGDWLTHEMDESDWDLSQLTRVAPSVNRRVVERFLSGDTIFDIAEREELSVAAVEGVLRERLRRL